jgi:hypothetical protein
MKNETPSWYYCSLDGAGLRRDRELRPELSYGSVDFLVNKKDYSNRPSQISNLIFGIDISQNAVELGFSVAALAAIRSLFSVLKDQEGVQVNHRIGIFTFNSIGIQFYPVKLGKIHPIKIVQVEVTDPVGAFPPNEWIYSVAEQSIEIECLLETIPSLLFGLVSEETSSSMSFNKNTATTPTATPAPAPTTSSSSSSTSSSSYYNASYYNQFDKNERANRSSSYSSSGAAIRIVKIYINILY